MSLFFCRHCRALHLHLSEQLKVSFGGHCCINVADGSLRGSAKNVLPSPFHERESKASESSFQVLRPNIENFCTK